MPAAVLTPITETDLPAVGAFLHANLNQRISPQSWSDSLRHPWSELRPNFGMQLVADTQLVGVFCAIYSDQTVGGRIERFCNPHSWCVLPEYRNQGISLLGALLKQPGYHFMMLTPNPRVAQIFRQLRFRDLADGLMVFPNLPAPAALRTGAVTVSDPQLIAARLSGSALRDFNLHRNIPWLRFVAFGTGTDLALAVYKRATWKRLPCARLLHVGDPAVFGRHHALLRHHLLLHHGLLVSQVESRLLGAAAPHPALHGHRTQAKLFLSPTLADSQICNLYSELVALDI
jgi:hypothetical protein